MNELAQFAGVSPATVSRVLNNTGPVSEKTRRRVLEAVERHQYQPNGLAQGLVHGRSSTVGVVITYLDNPFYAGVLTGVQQMLSRAGYSCLLGVTMFNDEQERRHLQDLRQRKVDGFIVNPTRSEDGRYPNGDLIHAIRSEGKPVVVIQDYLTETSASSVGYDIASGLEQAIGHLAELGHRRIGFISLAWRSAPARRRAVDDRVRGYVLGLNRNGLLFDPELTLDAPETYEGGAEAAMRLMRLLDPPTALLAHNDTVAIGTMHGLRALGKRVPEDVSVVGCDDTEICPYLPTALTSVALPKRELGEHAASLLLSRLSEEAFLEGGDERVEHLLLPAQLRVRASTGPGPRAAGNLMGRSLASGVLTEETNNG